jgi:putative transposase
VDKPHYENQIDVRWHPRDMGAVEACLGDEWFEIRAVDPMMEGRAAMTWLNVTRSLRAADPKRKSFDRNVVLAAIDSIQERNAAAMAMAGLLVEDWSKERVKSIEATMFQGAFCSLRKDPTPLEDGFGRSIPEPDRSDHDTAPTGRRRPNSNLTFEG